MRIYVTMYQGGSSLRWIVGYAESKATAGETLARVEADSLKGYGPFVYSVRDHAEAFELCGLLEKVGAAIMPAGPNWHTIDTSTHPPITRR